MSEPKLIRIASFGSTTEANLAKGRLEEEGIPACLEGETTGDMLWHVGSALGGVRLMVFEDQADKAVKILEESIPQELDENLRRERAYEDAEATPDDDDANEHEEHTGADDAIDSPALIARRDHARRAWIAAVLGPLLCPPLLNFYSLYLLFRHGLLIDEDDQPGDWRPTAALVVDLAVLGAIALIIWTIRPGR